MESSIAVRDLRECDRVSGFSAGYNGAKTRGAGNPAAKSRTDGVELDRTNADRVDGLETIRCTGRCGRWRNLFSWMPASLYLFDEAGYADPSVAAVGHRSEYARSFPAVNMKPELLQHIQAVHATFLSAQGLPLPAIFREVQQEGGARCPPISGVLWSKDRVIGVLTVGSRTAAGNFAGRHQLVDRGGQPDFERRSNARCCTKKLDRRTTTCGARKSNCCTARKWRRWAS